MKLILYISLIASFASCKTAKTTASVATGVKHEQRDSTHSDNSSALGYNRMTEKTDTPVGIPAKEVKDNIPADETKMNSAVTGKPKPVFKSKTDKGLTAWVAIDTNGNIAYGAKSDSLTILVKGLIRERDSVWGLYKSEQFRQIFQSKDSTAVSRTEKVLQKRSWTQWGLENIYWLLPLVWLIIVVLKNILKGWIPLR